jgi:hypothetical protein
MTVDLRAVVEAAKRERQVNLVPETLQQKLADDIQASISSNLSSTQVKHWVLQADENFAICEWISEAGLHVISDFTLLQRPISENTTFTISGWFDV